ncbi:MAG: hypothetical protein KR126chlam3_01542 [Chlamydiae bacterium]|nr:hypothetical protein [Chlamydiota bacterium]
MLFLLSVILSLLSSCVHYSVPMQSGCDPLCADIESYEGQLSDVLEIDWENLPETCETSDKDE